MITKLGTVISEYSVRNRNDENIPVCSVTNDLDRADHLMELYQHEMTAWDDLVKLRFVGGIDGTM